MVDAPRYESYWYDEPEKNIGKRHKKMPVKNGPDFITFREVPTEKMVFGRWHASMIIKKIEVKVEVGVKEWIFIFYSFLFFTQILPRHNIKWVYISSFFARIDR